MDTGANRPPYLWRAKPKIRKPKIQVKVKLLKSNIRIKGKRVEAGEHDLPKALALDLIARKKAVALEEKKPGVVSSANIDTDDLSEEELEALLAEEESE